MIKVERKIVPQYEMTIGNQPLGEGILLSETEARQLHHQLCDVLNIDALYQHDCGSAFSHDAHVTGNQTYCSGRSQDRT